jgi:hypothetical protein
MDSQTEFDSLISQLKERATLEEGDLLALDKVSMAVLTLSGERRAILSKLVPGIDRERGAEAALVLADVVSVAVAHAIRAIEKRFVERREHSTALVDLWGRAEACRALWLETYVLWPSEKASERRRALAETVLQLSSESMGMALRFSSSSQQYVDFVAKVSVGVEQLKSSNA